MSVLNQDLAIYRFFEQLCAIPHGSYNEGAVADWLVEFAKARSLSFYRDDMNNVILRKPASAGYESHAPVMLQAHTDTASAAVRITAIIFFFIVIIPFLPDLHLGALILTKFPPSVNPEEICALLTDKQTEGIITLFMGNFSTTAPVILYRKHGAGLRPAAAALRSLPEQQPYEKSVP